MKLTELQKKKIREICWRAVNNIDININDRKVIEEGLYRAFINEGGEGTQGPAGEDGKSAYELAVEQGYQGSLDEWLDSLQGQDGAPGANGINAEITECTATVDNTSGSPQVTVTMGGTSSKRTFKFDFTGLVGPQGATGANGANGTDGKTPVFESGTATSVESTAQPSVQIVPSGTDDSGNPKYIINVSIPKGQKGDTGDTGPAGADGATGANGQDGAAGENGKTPQMQIGNVTTVAAGGNATASVAQDGTDDSGNPIYKINLGIPRGNTGATGPAGTNGTNGTDGATPNITINATVDSNTGTPSVNVTESGTAANPVINLAFHNLKGENGLDGEDASINLTQQMPGKVMFFPNSHDNTYRPVFNMNDASNAYFVDNVCQLRFSPGDSVIDGDGKVWSIVSTSDLGMTGTGGNDPAMKISLITQTT